ncbi:MAG: hypothetical protein FWG80_01755 [Alphaproteobacteria bacterium]|nr:hypothetical protein [Alphaproteobacteria bacterium]
MKNKITTFIIIITIGLVVGNRIREIRDENAREIFNISRFNANHGVPVETMTVETQMGTLYEPVAIRHGNIYVSANRINRFKPGQKLSSGGTVVSVSRNIDLNTGLFIIKTSAASGNDFIEIKQDGIFIPLSAITDSSVMVSQEGIATRKSVSIIMADARRAIVKGLSDGEIVILTKVEQGTRIR